MPGPRERPIDVDAHLKSPDMDKVRRELAETVRQAHNEMDERGDDFIANQSAEEDRFIPDASMLNRNTERARGPLSNRMQQERMRAVQDAPIPPPPKYRNLPEGGVERPRRAFDPDIGDNEVEQEYISNKPRSPVSNRLTDTPIPAPDISEIQRLAKKLADQEAEIAALKEGKETATANDGKKAPGRLAARRKKYDSKYVPVVPPSQNNFYSHFAPSGIEIKKIDTVTQQLITEAKQTRNISTFIDAVGATLRDIDIRDVTPEDWFYILYWHKYNSYNRTPLILTWTSKYGNENRYIIQESDLKYVYPTISQEDYKKNYYDKGIVVPTLRDWELLNTDSDLSKEDRDIFIRAQYFKGDTIEDKVDNYFENGENLDALQSIEELKRLSTHGVVHTVDVVDALFDPQIYIKNRKEYRDSLIRDGETYRETPVVRKAYIEESEIVSAEIAEMEATLKNGGEVRAEVETQPVRFNALDMFPFL